MGNMLFAGIVFAFVNPLDLSHSTFIPPPSPIPSLFLPFPSFSLSLSHSSVYLWSITRLLYFFPHLPQLFHLHFSISPSLFPSIHYFSLSPPLFPSLYEWSSGYLLMSRDRRDGLFPRFEVESAIYFPSSLCQTNYLFFSHFPLNSTLFFFCAFNILDLFFRLLRPFSGLSRGFFLSLSLLFPLFQSFTPLTYNYVSIVFSFLFFSLSPSLSPWWFYSGLFLFIFTFYPFLLYHLNSSTRWMTKSYITKMAQKC